MRRYNNYYLLTSTTEQYLLLFCCPNHLYINRLFYTMEFSAIARLMEP